MSSERPFSGIEVVEFGQFIAVPYCAQLLADGGAHVIKIEALDGDPVRHLAPLALGETRHFISRNKGKHTLPLDLKHPLARTIIDALVARADVVLTNLRPGLAAELGLDHETLSKLHPRLIVGNVTAFGPKGPDANLAGMDLVVQARSGLMAANGRVQNGLPVVGDPPVADYMCAMMLAFGISAALFRRTTSGLGGEVDVSLLMAAMTLQNNMMMRVLSADGPVHTTILDWLAEARAEGVPFTGQAAHMPAARVSAMGSVYYRTYATKDEAIAVACVSPGLQRTFMRAVGLTDESHERPIADRDEQARHYASLQARMETLMASRTTDEWKAILDAHGVPASGVKFPVELLDDEQALANGMLHDIDHPALGKVRVLSTPVTLGAGGFVPSGPTPPFGSEVREILASLGFATGDVERFIEDGATRDHYTGSR